MVQVSVERIQVQPGSRVLLEAVNWQHFEEILVALGDRRNTRIAYSEGTLEIMAPLPEHETDKVLLGDLVKILLDAFDRDWISLGSTTFKQELMRAGIEPDDCFYIQNAGRMVGKKRLDLSLDPPPDLAIEIDVTSKTQISAYLALQVPELWCYSGGKLAIHVYQNGQYVAVQDSPTLPGLDLQTLLPQYLARADQQVMSEVRRAFRDWVRSQLPPA
jgi:Uma2 family endonuclease